MKKTLWKGIVFVLVFLISAFAAEKIMNKDRVNMTMEIAPATFPLITIERNGTEYNELHGYIEAMDTAFQKENVIVLGDDRRIGFFVETYGADVGGIIIEVRSIDGERLIEKTEIENYLAEGNRIHQSLQLKDLIEKDQEYLLTFLIRVKDEEIRYYSRVLWSDSVDFDEKLAFAKDFHDRLFDKEAAKEIAKYLEPNSALEDNKSFYKVNIHSNFRQITYGNLKISQVTEPVIMLNEITGSTACFVMDFLTATEDGKGEKTYYRTKETYKVWYSSEVQYLLNYERSMVQLLESDTMYANDKFLLGITDWNVQMMENDDGNVVAFVDAGRLYTYNQTTNSLAVVFSFEEDTVFDRRTMYDHHNVRILNVDEGGNVQFAVYGYMNRGRHEGKVGIQLCSYDSALNTIEEIIYIPYKKSYDILQFEMDKLLFLNQEGKLFLTLEDKVYSVDLTAKKYYVLMNENQNGEVLVSGNNSILVEAAAEEQKEIDYSHSIKVYNLNNETEKMISVSEEESIRPLGFMGEDIIYGVARNEDIQVENTGQVFFPMYKLCISDYNGNLLKEYAQEAVYITDCSVEDNQISIIRIKRLEDGKYISIEDDHITNNAESVSGKNTVVAADIDVYERYVQIQTKSRIDEKNIKILTPKEVVFEGGRTLDVEMEQADRFYAYGIAGVEGIFDSPAAAVNYAYEISGNAADAESKIIWRSESRANRNQIMAITAESVSDEKGSIAVCVDTILKYEGILGNSQYWLEKGQQAAQILQSYLEDYKVLELTGCNLNAVLYYVNREIPVMAVLKDQEAVLITGFNSSEIVIMEPSTGRLYKKGFNATIEWLEQNGNCFITYRK